MENNREALLKAIAHLKDRKAKRDITLTDDEIARTIGITEKQLAACINGEEDTPDDLASKVMSAFTRTTMIRSRSTHKVREEHRSPQGEPAIRENNRRSLKAFIGLIKDRGKMMGREITEEELAGKIDISVEQLQTYLADKDRVPNELPHQLLTSYQGLLDAAQLQINRESLKRSIIWVRNLGLAKGEDITLGDMAQKINLSKEQLYAYLNGEIEIGTINGLWPQLEEAYKALFRGKDQVDVIEDLNKIMKS